MPYLDAGFQSASDEEVPEAGRQEERIILVWGNTDFGTLLAAGEKRATPASSSRENGDQFAVSHDESCRFVLDVPIDGDG